MKPGEEIRLVKENLAFAVALWKAAVSGRVPPGPLLRPSRESALYSQQAWSAQRSESELAAELTRSAANQMRAAFTLSALQSHRSLAVAFPGEPIQEEWIELRAALSSMYLIGRAVQRSILQPVWECPPPYRRLFHIRRLGFTLNATGLEGRVLSWDHFGGLERYLLLLEYIAQSADAAVAGDQGRASRTLPKGLGSPQAEFGGIIGSPSALSQDVDGSPGVSPPVDYPGNLPERRLAPDAPPFEPPRIPDAPDVTDSWDIALAEQAGRWHTPPGTDGASPTNSVGDPSGRQESSSSRLPFSNMIGRFVAERCETGEGRRVLAGELYAGFLDWCRDMYHQPVSQRAFGMRLTNMGLRRKRRGHGKHWWEGICLADAA